MDETQANETQSQTSKNEIINKNPISEIKTTTEKLNVSLDVEQEKIKEQEENQSMKNEIIMTNVINPEKEPLKEIFDVKDYEDEEFDLKVLKFCDCY